jgi:hypothetical protein
MITCDTSILEKQLVEFHKEAIRKMEGMVRQFSYTVSFTAIGNTALGDADVYLDAYIERLAVTGLQPIEGFARGSWQVTFGNDSPEMQELYGESSGKTAEAAIKIHLLNYKLGQDVYVSNVGPYIQTIEFSDWSKHQGRIVQPTLWSVMNVYQLHLDDYYKKA